MNPYPLTWPATIPRWKSARQTGQFRTSLSSAMNNVKDSLRRFATDSGKEVKNLVISSNVTLGEQRPDDPGVSIWFEWDGISVCIPVDRYTKVEANLQAIHHVIEARRTELRHGTLSLVRASLQGFTALPAPGGSRSWRAVLGFEPPYGTITKERIEGAYRLRAKEAHPDAETGSREKWDELKRARETALSEVSS